MDVQLVNRIGYASLYSEQHEQPLWVSYKLTKAEVQNKVAKQVLLGLVVWGGTTGVEAGTLLVY